MFTTWSAHEPLSNTHPPRQDREAQVLQNLSQIWNTNFGQTTHSNYGISFGALVLRDPGKGVGVRQRFVERTWDEHLPNTAMPAQTISSNRVWFGRTVCGTPLQPKHEHTHRGYGVVESRNALAVLRSTSFQGSYPTTNRWCNRKHTPIIVRDIFGRPARPPTP